MASGLIRSSLTAVKNNIPSHSSQSLQLMEAAQELLDKGMEREHEMTSFDEFSELVVSYLRNKIQKVTEDVSLISSKRTKIWAEFHRLRLNDASLLHMAWKNLLDNLKVVNKNPFLMQSLYEEIHSLLVKEYFRSQFAQPSASSRQSASLPITFTEDELNAMRYACG